ncbi:histamine H2 receptor [Rhagoletis pomonella]|uniref:histamine H2 receptor n=1 Tax=Rhagoletis pomonella TaxID=28610 RepID=UPI0017812706|nr:histamine H2 receptor [Rhagoletis pomonella]
MSATAIALNLLEYHHQMLHAIDQKTCNARESKYLERQQQQQLLQTEMATKQFALYEIINDTVLALVQSTTLAESSTTPSSALNVSAVSIAGIGTSTIFWVTCNILIMICIVAGNALSILAITTCRRLRSLIANIFILSLAVSDFGVGLLLPYHIAFYLGSNLGQSKLFCVLRFVLIIFSCCVSIMTLITIAVDRYIAIVYALHYRRFMTRRVSFLIIAFNWMAGATVAIIPVFSNRFKTAIECEFYQVLPIWYMAGVIIPGFVLIWLFMLLIYWRIMREAAKQMEPSRCNREMKRRCSKKLGRRIPDWKSMQIVVLIMGCFSICWLTYFIVVCLEIVKVYNISLVIYKMAFSLAMFNSAMNPIIYCWKNKSFRRAYWRLLRCKNPNHNKPNAMDLIACSVNSIQSLPRRNSTITIAVIPMPTAAPIKGIGRLINEKAVASQEQK